ncbi:hypothetical protein JXB01_01175, partial [Candidatus Micrarchaeota archaeon]|nr:hypothetical protein [Candidatus Micrarchaeota archaeon]
DSVDKKNNHYLKGYFFSYTSKSKFKAYAGMKLPSDDVFDVGPIAGLEYLTKDMSIIFEGAYNIDERITYLAQNEEKMYGQINSFINAMYAGKISEEHKLKLRAILLNMYFKKVLNTGKKQETTTINAWPFVVHALYRHEKSKFFLDASVRTLGVYQAYNKLYYSMDPKTKKLNQGNLSSFAEQLVSYDGMIDLFTGQDGKWYVFGWTETTGKEEIEMKTAGLQTMGKITEDGIYLGGGGSIEIVKLNEEEDISEELEKITIELVAGKEDTFRIDFGGSYSEDLAGAFGRVMAKVAAEQILSAAGGYIGGEKLKAWQTEGVFTFRLTDEEGKMKTFYVGVDYIGGETKQLSDEEVEKTLSGGAMLIDLGMTIHAEKGKWSLMVEPGFKSPFGEETEFAGQIGFKYEPKEGIGGGIYFGKNVSPGMVPDIKKLNSISQYLTPKNKIEWAVRAYIEYLSGTL